MLNVSATVTINTYFIRVLSSIGLGNWKTLTVGESAQATRANLVMSIVLDVSGSMNGDGGIAGLKIAVPDFINQFENNYDQVAMVTFRVGQLHPFP